MHWLQREHHNCKTNIIMKILKCILLLLGAIQLGFSQSEYNFNYQYFYFNDGLVFVDSLTNRVFALGADGELLFGHLNETTSQKKYYRNHQGRNSGRSLIQEIQNRSLTMVDDDIFQLQNVNGNWLYLEIDDSDLDFDLASLKTCKINGAEILITKDVDWGLGIFILFFKETLIGISEDGELGLQEKIKLSTFDKDAIEKELKVRYPKQTPRSDISYFTFINGHTRLVDENKQTVSEYKLGQGEYAGIHLKSEKYDSSELQIITGSLVVDDLEKLKGKLFRDSTELDKEIYYVHVVKNIIARIVKQDTSCYVLDYETLIYHKVANNKSIFIGKNIVVANTGNEIVLVNRGGKLQSLFDIETLSLIKKIKLSLYEMKVVNIFVKDKYYLYDRSGKQKIFDIGYDNIFMNDRYIVIRDAGQKMLYNSQFKKMDMSRAKHWGLFSYSPELIDKETNQSMYLYYDNTINVVAEPTDILICDSESGTSFYNNIDNSKKNRFIQNEYAVTSGSDFSKQLEVPDTTFWKSYAFSFIADSVANLIHLEDVSTYDYLDGLLLAHYEKDYVPESPFIYYKNGKKGLARQVRYDYKTESKKFSSFFEYDGDVVFTYHNTTHPIRFTLDGLHGYIEINKHPFAKELGLFEGGYARYTLPSGQSGWLSKHGDLIDD